MAGRIRDEDVRRVREAANIAEVAGAVLQLRTAGGGNLKGLCPFHDERTASFQVKPGSNVYYCFGCGASGDVIKFVMDLDHLSFGEAVERLAGQYNIELRYAEGGYSRSGERGERTRLIEAHQVAADYFAEQLSTPGAAAGREFLAGRGFDQQAIATFGVGYAPGTWENLVRHLRGRGFTDKEISSGGLASKGRRGLIDRFRNRLTWPIADVSGEIIGFGARRLDDDPDSPKYLNTPETPIYRKSAVLYGLNLARREIAKQERAVIVEGYTDVMACYAAGVRTAVATCGTAFGPEHVKILRRLLGDRNQYLGCEVVFAFDGDSAGQKAALRTFLEDQRFVTQTFVAVEADGLDPCELRQAKGDAAVRELIETRSPLFEFAIRAKIAKHALDSAEGRVAALRATAPIVASIRDRALRPEYTRRLAGWTGLEEASVREAVQTVGGRQPVSGRRAANGGRHDPGAQAEREALKAALQYPGLAAADFDGLGVEEFTAPGYAAVRSAIARARPMSGEQSSPAAWLALVADQADDDQIRGTVAELAVEPMLSNAAIDEFYVRAVLTRVRLRSVDLRIAEARSALQRLDPDVRPDDYRERFAQLVALEQYRRTVSGWSV